MLHAKKHHGSEDPQEQNVNKERKSRNTSRRKFLRNVAVGAATITAPQAIGQTTTTTRTAPVEDEDISAALRVVGHEFAPAECKLMVDGLTGRRELFKSIRQRMIDPRIEPAVQFSPRVPGVRYPSTSDSCTLSDGPLADYNGDATSLAFATVTELSRLIQARKVTSTQLTQMCLDRLDSIGRELNAVVTLTRERALAQAKRADEELAAGESRGPLHGIPYGAKDMFATKGVPTSWGVEHFAKHMLDYDATVVERLENAGAVLCAKLSLGELAMGDVWFGGRTRNPWNREQGSSGSSAGPCATVAAGCLPLAIGSETLGSIVSPCMVNGTCGLRPTYGRISRYGAMPLSRTMDKIGPIARGVEDLALTLSAIHGPDDRDPTAADIGFAWNGNADVKQLRIGYDVAAFESMAKSKNGAKREAYERALSTVRTFAGRELTPIHLPPTDKFTGLASLTIAAESASSFMELVTSGGIRSLKQQDEGSWPNTFRKGMLIPAADYLRAMQVRAQLQRAMHEALSAVDAYVTIPYAGPTIAYTNLTGHPTCVARCGMNEKQPLMIEFVGNLYREDASLCAALAFERATPRATWPQ
jgi:Asp-tRNA(Asn)/Glu-tRNA(Gln) amidotransferase A subunit family amidase